MLVNEPYKPVMFHIIISFIVKKKWFANYTNEI